jgi:general stress protein YciG
MTESMENGTQAAQGNQETAAPPRARRGFAAMDPELVRAISRRGGIAAHVRGTAHEFTPDEARAAGRKGGLAAHRNTQSTPRDDGK